MLKVAGGGGGSTGAITYKGTWNANTNTPTLASSVGSQGDYYVVSVAGTTNLNGITDWQVGDWAVFNGSVWQKIDNTDAVTSVNGQTGTVTITLAGLGAGSIATQNANAVTITGGTLTNISDLQVSGSTTAGNALVRIEQTGAGYALLVEDSANPDATPFVVHESGGVSVGNTVDVGSGNLYVAGNMAGNIITAVSAFTGSSLAAVNSAGLTFKNASGNAQMQMGSGGGDNISLEVATNINPANAAVSIAPTGTGVVHITSPTNGTMDGIIIGTTSPKSGTFTNLEATAKVFLNPANEPVSIAPTGTGTVTINPQGTGSSMTNVAINGGSINVSAVNTVATTSNVATFATAALPLEPEGYITINVNGIAKKVPYYGV